jgi:putative hydrolase of the HAD superfamily
VIKAVVSDFGGVVTLPLFEAFKRAHEEINVPVDALRKAMELNAARYGEPTLFKLERGQITEAEFISGLEATLSEVLERPITLGGYGQRLMGELQPNEPLLAYYRALRDERGIRLAILTNNVREWHDAWRTRLKVDELFELVVDSAFEGCRKPEPEIYALTLERLGLPAGDCAFVDDVEVNVTAARDAGMHAIHFRETGQVIAELEALGAR